MNKLEGLYELKDLNIPSIEWNEYKHDTILDDNHLWTIRTAVFSGFDLSLPRMFGKDSKTAKSFADKALETMSNKGVVIYYPFLLAERSGVLQFNSSRTIVEAVNGDIGNLLSKSKVDERYVWDGDEGYPIKENGLLSGNDINQLLECAKYLRRRYSMLLMLGNEMQLEFSYAYECSCTGERIGLPKLVFFEIRTL